MWSLLVSISMSMPDLLQVNKVDIEILQLVLWVNNGGLSRDHTPLRPDDENWISIIMP